MNAAQGVILVMGSALVLWLMWSAQSPFASASSGPKTSSTTGPIQLGPGAQQPAAPGQCPPGWVLGTIGFTQVCVPPNATPTVNG